MNTGDPRFAGLDARMRRMLGGLDAREGFEARVMDRVAKLAAAPRADLRAQFERRHELVRRRLRRMAVLNGITIAGLGAAAFALAWRYLPAIERLATEPMPSFDPMLLIAGTLAALAAGIWPLLKRTGIRR